MKNINLKTMKLATAVVMSLGMMLLSGCGSSSSGGTPATPPISPYVQNPCMTGANCAYQTPNSVKGFYSQSASFPAGIFQNNGSVLQPQGAVVNILQEAMGVCNRGYYNGGYADCQNWVNGIYDLVFMVNPQNPNQVSIIFRAYPQQQYYTYNLPRWDQFFMSLMGWPAPVNPQGAFNPMILTATIHPVNNSQGFEIRSYGPQVSAGYNKLLQLQVPFGKIEDQSFNYELFWNGDKIAIGTLVKCQSPTCGL